MKRAIMVVIAIVVIASIATASFYIYVNKEDDTIIPVEPGTPKYDYTGGTTLYPGEYREAIYNEITGDYRPIYDIDDSVYEWIFGNLPKMPKDFFDITKMIYEGKITDYSRLSDAYWKQPEFYPSWFLLFTMTYPENPIDRWTPEGFGCYPGMKQITMDKGTTATVETYFRTGFGVESYQGIVVKPTLPAVALNVLGKKMFDQPSYASDYISVKISNPDNSIYNNFKNSIRDNNVGENDWFVVLKPTYSLIKDKSGIILGYKGFPEDWVQILQVEITVAQDTPVGDYVVAVNAYTPSFGINQEFYYSNIHEYYGQLYYPVGMTLKQTTPMFQVILSVV